MLKSPCRLDGFILTKHSTEWVQLEDDSAPVEDRHEFSIRLQQHQEQLRQVKVTFTLRLSQTNEAKVPVGFQIEITCMAIIVFNDDIPMEELGKIVPPQVIAIAYGTIRGLVANATGMFPNGPHLLPSLSPGEILSAVAAGKAADEKKESAKIAPTHKTKRRPTKAGSA